MKLDWGFDKFLPLKAFTESSNGFLMDDTCVFGAEVFVSKEKSKGRGERLSMVKDSVMYKHVWKIDNFSKMVTECLDSKTFSSGDQKWYHTA
jgi:speckle-type POZ protein